MRRGRAVVFVLVSGVAAPVVYAQQFPQPIFQAQFSFSNPGARSMGFGGAFVALADDATAAFANPAGLVQLLEPEASVEIRSWSYSTPYTLGGRLENPPSGFGLDDTAGLRSAVSDDSLLGVSFLAFVQPKGRWSFAFSRHLQANFESATETQGLFAGGSGCCQVRLDDQRTTSDFELVTYGLSAAYRVSDALSVGVGLTLFDGELLLEAATYARDDDSLESLFAPNSFLPERLALSQALGIDDTDWGFTAGALYRLSSRWHLGAVYREGPTFEIDTTVVAGPQNPFGLTAGAVLVSASFGGISFPDGYGVGLAYRSAAGRVTTAFEWDRVEYSDPIRDLGLDDQEVDDADELRLGGEYVFLGATPVVALRAGAWLDPDHLVRGNGAAPIVDALMPPGDDNVHYALGLGLAFETFQIDLAIDLSELVDTAAISAIFTL